MNVGRLAKFIGIFLASIIFITILFYLYFSQITLKNLSLEELIYLYDKQELIGAIEDEKFFLVAIKNKIKTKVYHRVVRKVSALDHDQAVQMGDNFARKGAMPWANMFYSHALAVKPDSQAVKLRVHSYIKTAAAENSF